MKLIKNHLRMGRRINKLHDYYKKVREKFHISIKKAGARVFDMFNYIYSTKIKLIYSDK
jgi:hypothetical protein